MRTVTDTEAAAALEGFKVRPDAQQAAPQYPWAQSAENKPNAKPSEEEKPAAASSSRLLSSLVNSLSLKTVLPTGFKKTQAVCDEGSSHHPNKLKDTHGAWCTLRR